MPSTKMPISPQSVVLVLWTTPRMDTATVSADSRSDPQPAGLAETVSREISSLSSWRVVPSSIHSSHCSPADSSRVYATFGGKYVWSSADGGATWRQIDGNGPRRLPNLPVHSILADPANPDRLFVGTDLGVFVSTSRGLRWAVERTGFANAVTESLQIVNVPGGTTWLFAFTHGRGAWRVEMGK